jgi:hypothetical protein
MFYVAPVNKGVPVEEPHPVGGRDDLLAWARQRAIARVDAEPILFGLFDADEDDVERAINMEAIDITNGLWQHALSGMLPAYHRSKAAGELKIWEQP